MDGLDETDTQVRTLVRRTMARKRGSLPPPSSIDDELLLRYVDGAMSSGERSDLEGRLVLDLDAKERLAILAGAIGDAQMSRPLTDAPLVRAMNTVSRHVFHVAGGLIELLRGQDGATSFQPAVAVRGVAQDHSRPSAFQIERQFQTTHGTLSARFELHAEQGSHDTTAGDEALVDLVVHLGVAGRTPEGVRCKLLRDGRPIDSREVEDDGCTFTRLSPARYDVELRRGGVEVGRLLFDLRG